MQYTTKQKKHRCILAVLCTVVMVFGILAISGCSAVGQTSNQANGQSEGDADMRTKPQLTFIGHASMKMVTTAGTVIYIDPSYQGKRGDYDDAADIILITHDHGDHNNPSMCKNRKDDCQIITWKDAHKDETTYESYDIKDVHIEAVPSGGNSNHTLKYNVGYLVTADDVTIYHSGDTSKIDELLPLAEKHIDYAFYPVDGIYTMKYDEASELADAVGAVHNVPIHGNGANSKFAEQCEQFFAKGKLVLNIGETIDLEAAE